MTTDHTQKRAVQSHGAPAQQIPSEKKGENRISHYFGSIAQIKCHGPESKIPSALKYYDPERVIMGKKMKEHLPFAMAWWHNLCANGKDMFGEGTADKTFGAKPGTMEHAKAKVDAGSWSC